MNEIKAPNSFVNSTKTIFLAGSIEMDKAENWQLRVADFFKDTDYTLLNPRRDAWDSSWKQEMSFPPFREQVEWELSALEYADIILMYFDPATYSPISLLELGLFATSGKLRVCCPNGFWRKGNVDIVCARYQVPVYGDLDAMLVAIM